MVSSSVLASTFALATAVSISCVQGLDKGLYGINYDLRQGPDWDPNKCKSAETIAKELKIVSTITKNVRTYSLGDCSVQPVLTNAKSLGMTVWLGVWVSADETVFDKEVAQLQTLIDGGLIDANVIGFNVGSEAVYRKDINSTTAVDYLNKFKQVLAKNSITVPVSITDISDILMQFPEMMEASDVITVNQFPFWEKYAPSKAGKRFDDRIRPLMGAAGSKPVIITETGWSTAGESANASVASPEGAARYLNDFYLLASQNKWKYYYFQAFDSAWKAQLPGEENTVESHFGIYNADGTMKKEYAGLKFGPMTGGDTSSNTTSTKSNTDAVSDNDTDNVNDASGPGTVVAASDGNDGAGGAVVGGAKKSSEVKNNITAQSSDAISMSRVGGILSCAIVVLSMAMTHL